MTFFFFFFFQLHPPFLNEMLAYLKLSCIMSLTCGSTRQLFVGNAKHKFHLKTFKLNKKQVFKLIDFLI